MAYVITDECVACGTCAEECPNDAIVEEDEKYRITDDCDECGTCVDACPVGAIVKEEGEEEEG
jgi:ferredoxin